MPKTPDFLEVSGATVEQANEWVQTMMALPASTNPLNDDDGTYAPLGEVGDTHHLAGSFNDDVREFEVELGDTLIAPLVNVWTDRWTNDLSNLRDDVLNFLDIIDVKKLFLTIDLNSNGKLDYKQKFNVSNVDVYPELDVHGNGKEAAEFLVYPEAEDKFVFAFDEDDPFNTDFGVDPDPASCPDVELEDNETCSFTSGYYAQIQGLPEGTHSISFGGTVVGFGDPIEVSVTDIITVVPETDVMM